jgi:hypothetical protein
MGASSAEINEQISSTREHLDANLDVLEKRATSGLKRVGTMAAIGLAAGLVVGGAAFLIIRRMHKPSLGDRVHDALPSGLTDLTEELRRRFGNKPFKVVITSADADEKGSVWKTTAAKVAPTVATTAMSAIMAQFMKPRPGRPDAEKSNRA